jgi:hypothetical protein
MTMVTRMSNELDPELTRLFAQARAPLADDEFMAALLLKIVRARRTRLGRQTLGMIAIVIILALSTRLILDATAAAVRIVVEVSLVPADLLISPWGWVVSMLIGAWVLLRVRPSRR